MENLTATLLELFIIVGAAKIVGELFEHWHQPSVVGELLIGMIIGPHALGWIHESNILFILSELAVVFLLFQVGLESRLSDMLKVGRASFWVAVLGVVLPFVAGLAFVFAINHHIQTALFVAAAMVATSVGITARVLSDLRFLQSRESRIILGAAVIDDVLGMLVLALVTGISQGDFSTTKLLAITFQAVLFVFLVVLVGSGVTKRLGHLLGRLKTRNMPVIVAALVCLGLAALAQAIGLAAIIGAFLAGMIFAEIQDQYGLHRSMEPLVDLVVPVFFVIMGAGVDLTLFGDVRVVGMAVILTVLALATKLLGGGLAVLKEGWDSALIVGVGMAPRGEVGLIIAALGGRLKLIPPDLYAVIVAMCMATTLFMPPCMKWAVDLQRKHRARKSRQEGQPVPPEPPGETA